jgi:hypothetical protein
MLPNSSEAWIFIFVTCFTSFLIGQWLRSRRKKDKTNDEYIDGLKKLVLAETRVQTKKAKRKNRKTNKQNSNL